MRNCLWQTQATLQGAFEGAFASMGDSLIFYPSRGHKPMALQGFCRRRITPPQLLRSSAAGRACEATVIAPRRTDTPAAESFDRHDRTAPATLAPGGFLLENQDVGRDVRRRMGEPVRRLRALLPGKARRRGYRPDLFHPCLLQVAGCRTVRLQGLSEPVRPGSGLCPAHP